MVIYRSGLTGDHTKQPYKRAVNPNTAILVGRGRSRQSSSQVVAGALVNGIHRLSLVESNKLLRLSKVEDGNGATARQRLKTHLETKHAKYGDVVHGQGAKITAFLAKTLPSQKEGFEIVVRPLISYTEANTFEKHCKYGAYKDGSRYRCIQNLDHRRGAGRDATRKKDGTIDERTGLRRGAQPVPRRTAATTARAPVPATTARPLVPAAATTQVWRTAMTPAVQIAAMQNQVAKAKAKRLTEAQRLVKDHNNPGKNTKK